MAYTWEALEKGLEGGNCGGALCSKTVVKTTTLDGLVDSGKRRVALLWMTTKNAKIATNVKHLPHSKLCEEHHHTGRKFTVSLQQRRRFGKRKTRAGPKGLRPLSRMTHCCSASSTSSSPRLSSRTRVIQLTIFHPAHRRARVCANGKRRGHGCTICRIKCCSALFRAKKKKEKIVHVHTNTHEYLPQNQHQEPGFLNYTGEHE